LISRHYFRDAATVFRFHTPYVAIILLPFFFDTYCAYAFHRSSFAASSRHAFLLPLPDFLLHADFSCCILLADAAPLIAMLLLSLMLRYFSLRCDVFAAAAMPLLLPRVSLYALR